MQQQYTTAGSQYSGHAGYNNARAVVNPHGPTKRPRFHPAAIIILVLAIGLIFVGLVMTIISVWPGYTPVGGNPLKIVGPILLACGGVILAATIAYSCVYSKKRAKAMMNMSRSTLASTYPASHHGSHMMNSSRQMLAPHTPTLSVEAKPSKGILKNASSTSTYNGTAPSDSGPNRSRDSDVSSGSGSVRMDGIQVSMKPDPTTPKGFPNQSFSSDHNRSQQYGNPAYDNSFDIHNTSGSLGSGSASQSLVGMGMLSPLAVNGQPRKDPPTAKPKGWGARSGTANRSYEYEQHQQSVSTVTTTYRDITTPQRPTTARTPQRPAAPPPASTAAPYAPSSSTEV